MNKNVILLNYQIFNNNITIKIILPFHYVELLQGQSLFIIFSEK